MKLQAQAQAKLRKLVESESLPASQCGKAFLNLLEPLLHGGVLELKPSGGGQKLVVKNAGALRDFCRQRFPEADLPAEVGSRVEGVARFRDTKAMANRENEILSFRVWRDDALLKGSKSVGAAAAAAAHGVFSFLLAQDCPYELHGACALVENPAVFMVAEQLKLDVGLMIYGHGRISNRAIDWLARSPATGFSLLHLPDYDPVGLSEFQRLHARLGERVILHLPADLETRFAQFSNQKLLKKGNSQAMLAQLRRSNLPAIRRVVELIDRYNAGLEQEALLVKFSS
ncbi:MAG: hypothetical protein WCS42_15410 [Verrucomicrobiota bacterium]